MKTPLPDPRGGVLLDPELPRLLAAGEGRDLPYARQVYTNRALRMDGVSVVGFDMDYTLAVYSMLHIEELAFRRTVQRLVDKRGWPEVLRGLQYDQGFVIRGLVVDKDRGNLFKMDRHAHVGRCHHGRRPLTAEERRALYANEKIRLSLPRFAWIDTLFSLPEACLYAEIIEELEVRSPGALAGKLDTHRLYDEVRTSIDEVHRDGTLKAELRQDLSKYILRDPELAPALHKLRSGGKKLFVLTNSLWDYTDAVMSYLLDGQLPEYPSWRGYFDWVVCGAQKPAFFAELRPFVELDPAGKVANPRATSLERGKVYEGGNLVEFEKFTGHAGEAVLYVGDHIYGDIIRNRKASLWRTCFVVQELEQEIDYVTANADLFARLHQLERLRARLDDLIGQAKLALGALERARERGELPADLEPRRVQAKGDLEQLRRLFKACVAELSEVEERCWKGANPNWGLVFKEGSENSRFGEQVETYADLYTSRVSNFLYYSPMQQFRSPRSTMPHERLPGRRE